MGGASFFLGNVIPVDFTENQQGLMMWFALRGHRGCPWIVPLAASVKGLNVLDFSLLCAVTWKSFCGRGLLPLALLVAAGVCTGVSGLGSRPPGSMTVSSEASLGFWLLLPPFQFSVPRCQGPRLIGNLIVFRDQIHSMRLSRSGDFWVKLVKHTLSEAGSYF